MSGSTAHRPGYNRLSESVRKKTPGAVLCATFCGGRKCRYESSEWPSKDMAIDGLYSHWVTDDLLAMARPNAELIDKKDIIGEFVKLGIRSVINLQLAGEHAYCGPAPLTSSGFTYQPEIFMRNNIYYYNFGWKDYSHGTLDGLLDAVKVLTFALTQGKVAVHCHAGLGRTGVLLASYLVYSPGHWRAMDAIRHVRLMRPNALQTSSQLAIVQQFEHYLLDFSSHFASRRPTSPRPFTLAQHLQDQKGVIHGYEGRALRNIPKIIYVICERLLKLCRTVPATLGPINYALDEGKLPFVRFFYCARFDVERRLPYRSSVSSMDQEDDSAETETKVPTAEDNLEPISTHVIISSLINTKLPALMPSDAIDVLVKENQPEILAAALWNWMDRLKQPIFTADQELSSVISHSDQPDLCLASFDQGIRYTLEYLLRFIQRLGPSIRELHSLLRRMSGYLTQQAVDVDGLSLPADRNHIDESTLDHLIQFLTNTGQLIRLHDDLSVKVNTPS